MFELEIQRVGKTGRTTEYVLSRHKPDIIDEALKNKIVLCSPINLYAVLSVVRQASEYYALEKTSKEVLDLMQKFKKEGKK